MKLFKEGACEFVLNHMYGAKTLFPVGKRRDAQWVSAKLRV